MNTKYLWQLRKLLLILLISSFLSLSYGDGSVSILDSWNFLTGQANQQTNFILGDIRLPRILVCLLAGASLGLSGSLLQTFTHNPLADSSTLGINAGAGLMISIVISQGIYTDPIIISFLPLLAILGGLGSLALVFSLAHQKGQALSPVKIILTGVILSSILFSSIIAITGRINQQNLAYVIKWLSGQLVGNNWESLSIAGPPLILLWGVIYLQSHKYNIMSLKSETAISLGLQSQKESYILLLLTSCLVSFSLILAGNISFIGLLASHISKHFLPADHRLTLPASMLWGGLILLISDTLTRNFLIGSDIPTGIILSIIGAPYFLYLLYRHTC